MGDKERGVGKRPLDKGEKERGTEALGRGSDGEWVSGEELGVSERRELVVERHLGKW